MVISKPVTLTLVAEHLAVQSFQKPFVLPATDRNSKFQIKLTTLFVCENDTIPNTKHIDFFSPVFETKNPQFTCPKQTSDIIIF